MIAVLFEAYTHADRNKEYLDLAEQLRPLLNEIEGFISIERFESVTTPGKILSLSYWRDEVAVAKWRQVSAHRKVQAKGRDHVFVDYRIRVANVMRDYGLNERDYAPADSRSALSKSGAS